MKNKAPEERGGGEQGAGARCWRTRRPPSLSAAGVGRKRRLRRGTPPPASLGKPPPASLASTSPKAFSAKAQPPTRRRATGRESRRPPRRPVVSASRRRSGPDLASGDRRPRLRPVVSANSRRSGADLSSGNGRRSGARCGGTLGFVFDEKAYIKELEKPNYSILRKTHDYSITLKNRIENKCTIGIFSHRHLLDVIASLIEKGWIKNIKDFLSQYGLEKLVYNSILIAKIRGVILISYEELLNEKEIFIQKIAKQLDLSLNEEQIQEIIYETSIEKIKKKISNMSFEKIGNDLVNKETGLHINHINNPALNKWTKVLSEEDVNLIKGRKAYGSYNKFFGYNN